jgi:hypothetical protein
VKRQPWYDSTKKSSKSDKTWLIIGGVVVFVACLFGLFLVSSLTMGWFMLSGELVTAPGPTAPAMLAMQGPALTISTPSPILPSPTPSATLTKIPTATSTSTVTPIPSDTPTATVPPSTDTPTPAPTPVPPTATAPPLPPTDTPTPEPPPPPAFSFTIQEADTFPTNHFNFDVFVAITNAGNHPLSGFQVIGTHSSGMQVSSAPSASDWTENSGAMHYKAGNVKFQVLNSPTGVWTLQLVDGTGQPAAPPLEFPFDADNPSWHFVIYRQNP